MTTYSRKMQAIFHRAQLEAERFGRVVVGGDGQFNAAAEVAIAENADADGVQWCLLGCSLSGKAVLRGRCLALVLKLAGQAAPPWCRIIIAYRLARGNLSMASVTRI